MNKFFYSRRLRASPQGSSPWTSVALLLELPSPLRPSAGAIVRLPRAQIPMPFASVGAAKRTTEGRKLSEERNRGPGRGALGRRPQATTTKKLVKSGPGDDCQKTCQKRSRRRLPKNLSKAVPATT